MPSELENLQTRRAAICEEIAAISTTTAGGLPNSPTAVDHVGYRKSLYEELAAIDQRIATLEGPWEVFGEMEP